MMDYPGKYKIILLTIFFILLIISCIKPVYPAEMFLQHSFTLVMSVFLIIVTRKNSLSDRAFTLIVIFLLLHAVGARWIYSNVPYDEWFKFIAGATITELFNTTRNHYDRFVHLMSGLLMSGLRMSGRPTISTRGTPARLKSISE